MAQTWWKSELNRRLNRQKFWDSLAPILEGVSIGTGIAAATIDRHQNVNVQCGLDITA